MAIFVLAGVVLSLPALLYVCALAQIDGRPTPADPAAFAPAQLAAAWQESRESLPMSVEPLNPWSFTSKFFVGDPLHNYNAGERAAWQVARTYNMSHLHLRNQLWWHASGAALTIWVSRNWSAQQMAAALAKSPHHKNRT